MEARVQRRVQRYGWDLASRDYEALWQAQLAPARTALLDWAALRPGEAVLDVACGTGLVALPAAEAVGPAGRVCGIDIAGRMVEAAAAGATARGLRHATFARMDAESLALPDASFDVAFCALGLMYVPDPGAAVREMRRVVRPGGRVLVSVWGPRARCGWAGVFGIVEAEVASDVCPLFFALGERGALARECAAAGLALQREALVATTLRYADTEEACSAAFVGGPVALAWSRFDEDTRLRAAARYAASIAAWRDDDGYALPGEFVVVEAARPPQASRFVCGAGALRPPERAATAGR